MSENRKIRFTTNKGEFIVEMFEDKAPKTTKNFIELTEKGFYNGVAFHRVIDGFQWLMPAQTLAAVSSLSL